MIIKSFTAQQFAGIRNKSVTFSSGINVVLGNNETGKSTLINGIFHTLTEPQKILKSSKSGKEFFEECYPSGGANIIISDLCLEENGQPYTVNREWDKNGKDNRTRILMPNGDVFSSDHAEAKLNELLRCPTAVYDYLVFGRQKNEAQILGWCYSFFANKQDKDGIEEARNMVSRAISAASGISLEKFSNLLDEKIKKMADRWDFGSNGPQNGKMNWAKGAGTIVGLFYDYKNALNELDKLRETDRQLQINRSDLNEYAEKKAELELRLNALAEQRAAIENAENIRKLRENANSALKEAVRSNNDRKAAEQALTSVNELIRLNSENENRINKEKISKQLSEISALESEIKELTEKTKGLSELSADFRNAQALSSAIDKNNALLNAGTLHAGIKMLPPHTVRIQTADNSIREYTEGEADINGFFRIKIPNVGEITIAPQNVDVEKLLSENEQNLRKLDEILKRYSAETIPALKEMENENMQNTNKLNNLRSKRSMYPTSPEQLAEELSMIPTNDGIILPADIDAQIAEFLHRYGKHSLDSCKSYFETIISTFKEKYQSPENAQRIIDEITAKAAEYDKAQTNVAMTKEQFEQETADLTKEIELLNRKRNEANRNIGMLEAGFKNISEVEDEIETLRSKWELEIHKCRCYMRIREDFLTILNSNKGNRFSDFNKRFSEYLGLITDKSVTANDEAGMEELLLTSKNNNINNLSLLSAGTKKTLLLAFRLAVLDFFFPDGGGIIVIDDGLLDMDAKRRSNSAQLLKQFAQKNQVILMTCDENIADLVGGNRITIT